jgi:hypothetical protein
VCTVGVHTRLYHAFVLPHHPSGASTAHNMHVPSSALFSSLRRLDPAPAPRQHNPRVCPRPMACRPAPAPLPSPASYEEVGAEDVEQIHVNDTRRKWARRCRPVQEEHAGDGVLLREVEEVIDVVSRRSWPSPCRATPSLTRSAPTWFNKFVPQSRTSPLARCPLPSSPAWHNLPP